MVDRGLADVKSLVSHVYDFNDGLEAFEAVHKMKDRSGKSVLKTVILHGDEKDYDKGAAHASLTAII